MTATSSPKPCLKNSQPTDEATADGYESMVTTDNLPCGLPRSASSTDIRAAIRASSMKTNPPHADNSAANL